jgi:hypothetical protein
MMTAIPNYIPDDNLNVNIRSFVLDPLSVIIKLAIIGNKPIGSKIMIYDNIFYIQEPGVFQSIARMFYSSNKTDLHYIYNPIKLACQHYLTKEYMQKTPRIKQLFICAQAGIHRMMETYKNSSLVHHCLIHYSTIIRDNLKGVYEDDATYRDSMYSMYPKEIVDALNSQWAEEKIKIVLDIISFLIKDNLAGNNVKSLENIMDNIDNGTRQLLTRKNI